MEKRHYIIIQGRLQAMFSGSYKWDIQLVLGKYYPPFLSLIPRPIDKIPANPEHYIHTTEGDGVLAYFVRRVPHTNVASLIASVDEATREEVEVIVTAPTQGSQRKLDEIIDDFLAKTGIVEIPSETTEEYLQNLFNQLRH